MDELESIIFEIITNAGTAKSLVYEAMSCEYSKAKSLLKQSDEYLLKAHEIQTSIIQKEANGENITVSVLFVHAQDHLMSAMEIRNLAEIIVEMNKKINELEGD